MSTVDIPNIREPFIDTRSGQISRPWWIWMQQLMTRIGGSDGPDIASLIALITALIASAKAHENEINGQVALPPILEELALFDAAQVGAVPFDYVSEANASAPVQSVFGRAGAVTAQTGDYTVAQVTNAAATTGTLAQFAATTSAQLAGVLSDETGSGAAVFGTTPTLNQPNIVGTTTNNNAAAGSVGEYAESFTTGTALTSGVAANFASVSLTAGDWDVDGLVAFNPAGGTTISGINVGISTSSAAFQNVTAGFGNLVGLNASFSTGQFQGITAPGRRISIASTTTVYLVGQAAFGVSTMTGSGHIHARRIR